MFRYANVFLKNGEILPFPLMPTKNNLLKLICIYYKEKGIVEKDIKSIKIIIDGVEHRYTEKLYNSCLKKESLRKNVKEVIDFFQNPNTKFYQYDMILSNYGGLTYNKVLKLTSGLKKQELLKDRKKSVYKFFNITKVKANGKVKTRFICTIRRDYKSRFRYIKEILTKTVELEPEMLGVDKGVNKALDYFQDDFDYIVKLDFKNFFNQVGIRKFVQAYIKHSGIEYGNFGKTLGFLIAPYSKSEKRRSTWQGIETSTIASYIAVLDTFKKVKKHLQEKYNTTPVVYIDDLSFPIKGDRKLAEKAKKEVMDIIIKDKFYLNFDKCKVLVGNKQFFLGVNMNTKTLGTNSYINKTLRPMLNNYFHGTEEYRIENRLKTLGKLQYLKHISEDSYNKLATHPKYGNFINDLLES